MAELIDILFPSDAQEGTESIVSKWLKGPGDAVNLHEPILEIATDKVTVEVSAPASGVLREILKDLNEKISPNDILGRIEAGAAISASAPKKSSAPSTTSKSIEGGGSTELSPAVKKLLKEHNLDPSKIRGSGKGGRISHQDVLDHLSNQGPAQSKPSNIPSRFVPHTAMRRSIAAHMLKSVSTAPHVTNLFEVNLSRVMANREKERADFERAGVKLTLTAYFVLAAVRALKAVPEANSSWHEDKLEIFDDLNIGVATALVEGGLIVPVVKKAQDLDLFGIATTLQDLTSRAREGKLQPGDVQGGTFTISNHGVSGSLLATPIVINQPQSAILGIGKLEKRAKVVEHHGKETIEILPMAYVTLTMDHRVLDGFQANAFLSEFVAGLQV